MRKLTTFGLIGLLLVGVLALTGVAFAAPGGPGNGPGYGPGYGPPSGDGLRGPGYGPGYGRSTADAPRGPMMGPGQGHGPGAMPMQGMGPRGGMMGQWQDRPGMDGFEMDRHYIEEMIPHHEDAIAMADLALAQAGHPEVKALAERIKQTQAAEIDQMRAWYAAWYGTEVPASFRSQMMRGMPGGDPSAIDGAQPFDRAFIRAMVPHHQMAVMMSSHMAGAVEHPELKGLMESIATSQAAEIDQMRQWYRDWYGASSPQTTR